MTDPQELALAQAYEQLEFHPAFQNLLVWLTEEVENTERAAENASAEENDTTVRAKFIAWQQRKQVLTSIRRKLEDAKIYIQEAAEINNNERAIERDRASRNNWE